MRQRRGRRRERRAAPAVTALDDMQRRRGPPTRPAARMNTPHDSGVTATAFFRAAVYRGDHDIPHTSPLLHVTFLQYRDLQCETECTHPCCALLRGDYDRPTAQRTHSKCGALVAQRVPAAGQVSERVQPSACWLGGFDDEQRGATCVVCVRVRCDVCMVPKHK